MFRCRERNGKSVSLKEMAKTVSGMKQKSSVSLKHGGELINNFLRQVQKTNTGWQRWRYINQSILSE